jgi:CRISPR-associated Csx2 family protein
MTTTLVSFLGRVPRKPHDSSTGNYQLARYRFPDGAEVETPFFGLALIQRLNPDHVVFLGTRGSMWEVLLEHLTQDATHDDLRLALLGAAETYQVTADLVRQAQPVIESAIGKHCTIQLIDYGRDQREQLAILEAIAGAVPKGRVTLDITHGFRHLAALGLLSGFFLERIARLDIDGLYYGANDMREGGPITPVIRLDGLLAVQRWIDALDRFDQNGDYAVFVPLLEVDGVPTEKTRNLKRAAYFERTMNLSDAYTEIAAFQAALDRPLDGASGLFQPQLRRRLAWVKAGDLAHHQTRLAWFHFHNEDYLRAAIFAFEAVVTRECTRYGLDPMNHANGREPAVERMKKRLRWGSADHVNYQMLKNLRNGLAHGNPESKDKQYSEIIADPERLPRELESAMDWMLNKRQG